MYGRTARKLDFSPYNCYIFFMNKLVLSAGYVLVSPSAEEKSQGIIIKQSHEEQFKKGTVMLVGKAIKTWEGTNLISIDPPCTKDEVVLYMSGYDVLLDGKSYQIVRFSNIIATYV
jgi:co-chaperonin GroES (HSP10)